MARYTTLLFDADGTLLDFEAAEQEALRDTFQQYHIPFSKEIEKTYQEMNANLWKAFEQGMIDKKTLIYTRFVKLFQTFHIDADGVAFEDDYQMNLGKSHRLLPYALETIQSLSKEYDLYIVTNGVSQTQYSRLRDSGLDIYFKDIFVSEDAGYQKPRHEFFDYCFDKINDFDKERTLIIGDSLSSDIQGGINVGIDTCWYNPHDLTDDQHLPIAYIIKDLRELQSLIK